MEITESDERYPELKLYELSRLIKGFLIDYQFVQAVYLYPGVEGNQPYCLLFEVPSVPIEMRDLYIRFLEDLHDGPEYSLNLVRVYRNPHDAKLHEWMWYEVANARDIKGEGLHVFVLPGESVCLFAKGEPSKVGSNLPFQHSHDFSRITKDGNVFHLPEKAASVIKILSEEWKKGGSVLRQKNIIKEIYPDTSTTRVRDFFQGLYDDTGCLDTYKELIEPIKKPKGGIRLKS